MKKMISILLAVILALGSIPLTASAENAKTYTGTPPEVEIRVLPEGQGEALTAIFDPAAAYPNDAPADVDTAAEKAAWIAQKCRETGITDQWEIALWLHDWLIYNANYDYTYTRYTAEGVLLHGTGVCDSYARAYILLLREFGIECGRISSDEMDHAWNMVKIDGQWCHIDVTWDDPGEGGHEHHAFFGLPDELMDNHHKWDRSRPDYPSSTSYINYYPIRMGKPVVKSEAEMMEALCQQAAAQVENIEIYYLGEDANFPFHSIVTGWYNQHYRDYRISNITMFQMENAYFLTLSYAGPIHDHTPVSDPEVLPTCTTAGVTEGSHCSQCGQILQPQEEIPALGHMYAHQFSYKCDRCGDIRDVDMTRPMVDMHRMYNPNTGEHFYTGSEEERDNLIGHGWQYEGVGFTFPLTTGEPVYRLFDPRTGEHLYTMNQFERSALLDDGWNYEGIAFNSGFDNEVPQYRLHNPNASVGAYHFTASEEEKNTLIAAGWIYQGIGWYSLGSMG